ncbi:hypothetical protein [Shewanella aegiceratis]|uniref:hypothetical protein n=1 Tax=Shewanella aegiceratis TaxID=2864203 RepID=UPI001C65C0D0|nr:hypothetical protein [Shewanella aegiceratis]QYJ81797.1 hypothetical protein K0H80_16070 [Shewanella aegiceratis]
MDANSFEMHVNEMQVIWIQVTLLAFAQISNFISETRGIFDRLADQNWCMTKDLDDQTDLILSCFGAVLGAVFRESAE